MAPAFGELAAPVQALLAGLGTLALTAAGAETTTASGRPAR